MDIDYPSTYLQSTEILIPLFHLEYLTMKIIRRRPIWNVFLLSLAFQWNKIRIICANFKRFRHSMEKLITQGFINNYKQTCNLTKFRSFALQTMINMKIYRKPNYTLLKRLQNGSIHSKTESKLWHEPRKSSNTDIFPLLGDFDISGSALRINVNDHGKAGYFTDLVILTTC